MSLLGGLAQDNRSPKRIIWIGSNPFASVTVYVLTACYEHFCQDHAHLQGRIWPNLREFKPETSIPILINQAHRRALRASRQRGEIALAQNALGHYQASRMLAKGEALALLSREILSSAHIFRIPSGNGSKGTRRRAVLGGRRPARSSKQRHRRSTAHTHGYSMIEHSLRVGHVEAIYRDLTDHS